MTRQTATAADPALQPIAEINTTPLIDVMLVLLIMFVITIPVASNSLELALPTGEPSIAHEVLPSNQIGLGPDNRLSWNGAPIGMTELTALLAATHRMNPEPEVRFAPDALAPYGTAAQVVRTIKLSGVTTFGFVGNERFSEFGKPESR